MRSDHEVCYWPFFVKQGQEEEADKIIAYAKQELRAEIVRVNEDPEMYETDVLIDGRAAKMGNDLIVPGVGKVPAEVVIAGIVVSWRKGTTKPKIDSSGRMG